MNYTCKACIFDQLTIRAVPMESNDLKHLCRLNADDYDSYVYMTAIYELLSEGAITRTSKMDDTFQIA